MKKIKELGFLNFQLLIHVCESAICPSIINNQTYYFFSFQLINYLKFTHEAMLQKLHWFLVHHILTRNKVIYCICFPLISSLTPWGFLGKGLWRRTFVLASWSQESALNPCTLNEVMLQSMWSLQEIIQIILFFTMAQSVHSFCALGFMILQTISGGR